MDSASGNSSGSIRLQNSGSEEDLQVLMDQRKRKRMQSNRESARRSRMRKQQHLDELMAQVTQLKKDNAQILSNINITSQLYMNVEAENSILKAQMAELTQRLQSLEEIANCINNTGGNNNGGFGETEEEEEAFQIQTIVAADSFMNSMNFLYVNQPIMAAADIFHY
ncbi:bZIP transcription factor 53 [Cucumis melo var. makuwa]|uniref:BZIP transcription factor 53 n=2 Tax=Cucumis melo TaxID=3656 RepID=A0A1S3BB39_CUCME|nr:bZIP transcription factor 11 [Cucumis melo]KAA0065209.1 bZIP transcription factor 53 [Cucumis melo var. makuwa]